jgi:hypothetical protein
MDPGSGPDLLRILGYMLVVFVAIVGPMILLREKRRQGPPRGPRHTDAEPRPPSRAR